MIFPKKSQRCTRQAVGSQQFSNCINFIKNNYGSSCKVNRLKNNRMLHTCGRICLLTRGKISRVGRQILPQKQIMFYISVCWLVPFTTPVGRIKFHLPRLRYVKVFCLIILLYKHQKSVCMYVCMYESHKVVQDGLALGRRALLVFYIVACCHLSEEVKFKETNPFKLHLYIFYLYCSSSSFSFCILQYITS